MPFSQIEDAEKEYTLKPMGSVLQLSGTLVLTFVRHNESILHHFPNKLKMSITDYMIKYTLWPLEENISDVFVVVWCESTCYMWKKQPFTWEKQKDWCIWTHDYKLLH